MENELLEQQEEGILFESQADADIDTEEETPIFTSEVTHDLVTRQKVNKFYSKLLIGSIFRDAVVAIMLMVLFVYLFLYRRDYAFYARTCFVFALCYWGSILINILRGRKGGKSYKQMLAANGGKPIHNLITFTRDGFSVLNTYRESVSEYSYNQICAVAQNESFFLLYRDLSQCTVVSKDTLTGGTAEDFLQFLAENCTNWKDAALRTPRSGNKVRAILIAVWVFCLGFAVYSLFI